MDVSTFLAQFNYIELKNLCQTNKKYANICNNNELLREIMFIKNPKLVIPSDVNLVEVFRELNNMINKIVSHWLHINYTSDNRNMVYKHIISYLNCHGVTDRINMFMYKENPPDDPININIKLPDTLLNYLIDMDEFNRYGWRYGWIGWIGSALLL